MARIAVVGGGITGLAAAHRLRHLMPDAEIVLLEAAGRLGGCILTVRQAGFIVEGGPDSFLASKPRGIGLCRELGIEDRLITPNPDLRRTWVLHAGQLHRLPEGLTGLVPSRLEPLLDSELFTSDGKRRLEQEPQLPPRPPDGDETLAAFVERRFGREIYDRLIEPLMAGIYGGCGEQLSLAATFPQLRALELAYGSVLRGVQQASHTAGSGETGRTGFLTPQSGMQEIVDALVRRLNGVTVCTGRAIQAVERAGDRFVLQCAHRSTWLADAVIVAIPAHAAAHVLQHFQGLSEPLAGIPYGEAATVTLAYAAGDIPTPLDGYGYVIPRIENRPALASTWVSTKFPNRAPRHFGLVRVFLGRYGADSLIDLSETELIDLARAEVRDVLGITSKPPFHWVFRWQPAMPQYVLGHLDRLAAVDAALRKTPGLYLAGALWGVGIPDCIRSGEDAAQKVTAHLNRHQ
jgi:oxygen-dependent protoporphyrinogen oxidase